MPIDYKRYPPNWKTEIRPAIMKRANNTCEADGCNFKHGQIVFSTWVGKKKGWFDSEANLRAAVKDEGLIAFALEKPVKVVLTIAHLDHDETNWNVSLDRLKAMCQLCHLRYDAKEKYRRVMSKGKASNIFSASQSTRYNNFFDLVCIFKIRLYICCNK